MSYELLRELYLGVATNADITPFAHRVKFHVRTELDRVLLDLVRSGRDVVLTGNPGDGKSHIVRYLQDRHRLPPCEVELDLSAVPEAQALGRWRRARETGRPLLLCANQGPLRALLPQLEREPLFAEAGRELRGQLGHLMAADPQNLPDEPRAAVLIDLADRELLDTRLIADVIRKVITPDFLPDGVDGRETSAGRNIDLLGQAPSAPERLARVLALAGQRAGEHISFRQLWAGVSFALCAGKTQKALRQEAEAREDELGTTPLDNLMRGNGQGALLTAVRQHADPCALAMPQLDEDLWARGAPGVGEWDADFAPFASPASAWARGERTLAVDRFRSLKRLVTLFHSVGDSILEGMEASQDRPSRHEDGALLKLVLRGVRRLFLCGAEESGAPHWLLVGLPLWTNHTYQDAPVNDRPHVAVASILEGDFEIRRPVRAPWLTRALGPCPDIAWLHHRASGIALTLTDALLATLRTAAHTSGPLMIPEPISRFLARLSGWEEAAAVIGGTMAVIDRPRGALLTSATIRAGAEGLRYEVSNVG